jgi:hypothetical protein
MVSLILLWLLLCWSALGLIYFLRRVYVRVPKYSPKNLVHYVHPVDRNLLESLLDPASDFDLRWRLCGSDFREEQRCRMRLFRELLWRMSRNAAVVVEFEDALFGAHNSIPELGSKVREAAITVRLYCAAARLKLRVWLSLPEALRAIPMPDLARLRVAAGLDGLKAYEELKAAVVEAFPELSPAEIEALARNL